MDHMAGLCPTTTAENPNAPPPLEHKSTPKTRNVPFIAQELGSSHPHLVYKSMVAIIQPFNRNHILCPRFAPTLRNVKIHLECINAVESYNDEAVDNQEACYWIACLLAKIPHMVSAMTTSGDTVGGGGGEGGGPK
jgi:hypothetical protein